MFSFNFDHTVEQYSIICVHTFFNCDIIDIIMKYENERTIGGCEDGECVHLRLTGVNKGCTRWPQGCDAVDVRPL